MLPLILMPVAACHPARPPARAGEPSSQPAADREAATVRLVHQEGCCQGEPGRLAVAVEQTLARQPGLKLLREEPKLQPDAAEPKEDPDLQARTGELRLSLLKVKDLYLRMQMDAVRSELRRSLSTVKRLSGAYLQPEEIATFHLYLAAISLVTRQTAQARAHAEAAVRFYPELRPDPDVFTPPVRTEIEKARRARRTVEVSILSEPSGARVFWDGAPRGETPARLAAQAIGEHYLRLQRAGSKSWHDTIVLSSASAQLHVGLQPLNAATPAPTSVAADDVVLIGADDGGLRLVLQPREGSERTVRLAAGSSALQTERAVQELFGKPSGPEPNGRRRVDAPRSHWRRYWWVYVLAGAGVVALSVAIPLTVHRSQDGRPVKLQLP